MQKVAFGSAEKGAARSFKMSDRIYYVHNQYNNISFMTRDLHHMLIRIAIHMKKPMTKIICRDAERNKME